MLRPTAFALALGALLAPAARAQRVAAPSTTPRAGGFVVLLAGDTIVVEQLRVAGDTTVAELRSPKSPNRTRQTLVQGKNGLVASLRVESFPAAAADDAPPLQAARFRFDGDTVRVDGGATATLAVPAGSLPWVNLSTLCLEQIVRRARAIGGARVELPMFDIGGGQRFPATVERVGADSVTVSVAGAQLRLAVAADGRVLGWAVPAQRVLAVRVASIASTAGRVRPPDYSAPAGAPYTAENVTVPTPAGFTLGGTFTRPRAAGRVPAVVTITGSGQQERDEPIPGVANYRPFRDLADTLGRRGIAVLRLDDRGIGASGGNPATATSQDFAADVKAAIAWLRARPDVDPKRIALVGHSEGGFIAPMVAATDSTLGGIVLMAGQAWTGRRVSDAQQQYIVDTDRRMSSLPVAARDSILRRSRQARDSMAAALPWLRFWLDYDPIPTARRVRVPALVLQGATDRQVDPAQAEELAAALRTGGAPVQLRVFPTTNHLFLEDPSGNPGGYGALTATRVRPDVLGAIADWLAVTLRAR